MEEPSQESLSCINIGWKDTRKIRHHAIVGILKMVPLKSCTVGVLDAELEDFSGEG